MASTRNIDRGALHVQLFTHVRSKHASGTSVTFSAQPRREASLNLERPASLASTSYAFTSQRRRREPFEARTAALLPVNDCLPWHAVSVSPVITSRLRTVEKIVRSANEHHAIPSMRPPMRLKHSHLRKAGVGAQAAKHSPLDTLLMRPSHLISSSPSTSRRTLCNLNARPTAGPAWKPDNTRRRHRGSEFAGYMEMLFRHGGGKALVGLLALLQLSYAGE